MAEEARSLSVEKIHNFGGERITDFPATNMKRFQDYVDGSIGGTVYGVLKAKIDVGSIAYGVIENDGKSGYGVYRSGASSSYDTIVNLGFHPKLTKDDNGTTWEAGERRAFTLTTIHPNNRDNIDDRFSKVSEYVDFEVDLDAI